MTGIAHYRKAHRKAMRRWQLAAAAVVVFAFAIVIVAFVAIG